MQESFKAINVDVSEAKGFFQLLDVDGGGSLDPEEVVSGCLRLRGQAKAIELSLLMQENRRIGEKMYEMERHLSAISKALAALRDSPLGNGPGDIPSHTMSALSVGFP